MRKSLAFVVLAAVAALVTPTSAQAGGPTSVIVTNPSSGEASALYYTDKRYAELERLLTAGTPVVDGPSDTSGGSTYNLTWLIHDVTPWRIDQVYFDVKGGPWVATTQSFAEAPSGDEHVAWRQIPEGKALSMLLEGLLGAPSSGLTLPTTPEPDERVVEVSTTTWFSLAGWRWIAPGVVLGLGLGLLVARRFGHDEEPRQVLVDRAPERASL